MSKYARPDRTARFHTLGELQNSSRTALSVLGLQSRSTRDSTVRRAAGHWRGDRVLIPEPTLDQAMHQPNARLPTHQPHAPTLAKQFPVMILRKRRDQV